MKKILCLVMALTIVISSFGTVFAAADFSDMKGYGWAKDYVNTLVDKGGITGYPDGTFKPGKTITNAEFIKTVVGTVTGETFSKTGKHWASGYIDYALAEGLILGDEIDSSEYDEPMTREKMAVVIARTATNILEEELFPADLDKNEVRSSITDYYELCKYCKDYILDVYGAGIITGYPDNSFGGDKTATRAEAATMIVRLIDPSKRVEFKSYKIGEGKTSDFVSNTDFVSGLSDSKTYTLLSAQAKEKFNMVLHENNGVTAFSANGLGAVMLMIGDEVVEYCQAAPEPDTVHFLFRTDIKTIDYILSMDEISNTAIIIENPFK